METEKIENIETEKIENIETEKIENIETEKIEKIENIETERIENIENIETERIENIETDINQCKDCLDITKNTLPSDINEIIINYIEEGNNIYSKNNIIHPNTSKYNNL